MAPVRRAVIDVGTNSIKLLVADVAGHDIRPVLETSRQTRLGQGFYETHQLQAGPIASTAKAVSDFATKARQERAVSIRVIATSAARDAVNAGELCGAVEQSSGLKMKIISGEQEANWVFQGVTTDPQLARVPLLLLDVGGGSTEFILGQGAHKHFQHSFALGTVRLLAKLRHGDPPAASELAACRQWLKEFMEKEVLPKLGPALEIRSPKSEVRSPKGAERREETAAAAGLREKWQLVGTGGTASILGCMEAELDTFDRERLEATRLSRERLSWHAGKLWSLSLEQRQQIIGLPKNRADVILTGVAIYEAVMEQFGFSQLRLSTRGLRFAALMDAT